MTKHSEAAYQDQKLFAASKIIKTFGLNSVLKGIDISVGEGEVLALIGGNGAGKSTLMKIIMGIYQPDEGSVSIAGEKMTVFKPSSSLAKGIYMVPQEPLLFPNMTVEENILIGLGEKPGILKKRLKEIMEEINWDLDMGRKAMSLSIAEQQLVELLRGLMRQARVLILDEPTSALTFDEVESLFKIVEDLKKKGIGMIYITHRLTEVFQIATHVAIMRDGVITLNGKISEFTREMLVKGLLPDDCKEAKRQETEELNYTGLKPVFELKNFSGYGFWDISLNVYPGEVLGVAGVVGAGRTELAVTVFGKDKVLSGTAILDGRDVTGLCTREIIKAGINYVPEDRRLNGLFGISDVAANITSALIAGKSMGKIFVNRKAEYKIASRYVDDFRIKITGQDQPAGSLSGGNQQKIVIGRSLATSPRLVILDEPTRGIDAAARKDVYGIIHKLKKLGVAVMLISSDMEEIVELSDRAVVVYQGRIRGELKKHEITQSGLMSASFGVGEGKQVEV
ncbi:sugar ABC transporter ATP-binding protein [Clostridium boliviensis]|uniref:Autoinducer 2 import ATP-binding protein LsrA n=1 Tax=Clostridium boliviensis TaxID=318465 RepID=A0ABU4GKN0_9CLOT|nr:sugar ABC transporter ATP-binding protein [Clostridium boliviensis]MDW2798176.1 sugar ABC transporter ATP-binding protein [Clostridium boliviensis]